MPTVYQLHEIPKTKPATELIDGHLVQKVSPAREHGVLQLALGARLLDYAMLVGDGEAGTETDIDIGEPGGDLARLVPDVVFYRRKAVAKQRPRPVPDVIGEIMSPGDAHRPTTQKKRALYLAAGCTIVYVFAQERAIEVVSGTGVEFHASGDVVRIAALPQFEMPVDAFFATLD